MNFILKFIFWHCDEIDLISVLTIVRVKISNTDVMSMLLFQVAAEIDYLH